MEAITNNAFVHSNTILEGTTSHNYELAWDDDTSTAESTDAIHAILLYQGKVAGYIVISIFLGASILSSGSSVPTVGNVVFIDYTEISPEFQGLGLSRLLLLIPYLVAIQIGAYITSMDVGKNEQGQRVDRYSGLLFRRRNGEIYDVEEEIDTGDGVDFNNILSADKVAPSFDILLQKIMQQ